MILSPSLLSCDFGRLDEELRELEVSGLEWVHVDVMDGVFVPNITFGPPVIKKIRKASSLFFDVHLMIVDPERYISDFRDAGADLLVVHAEATRHLDRTLREIHNQGMKAGVALNPATPVSALEHVTDCLDLVLVMSVNPGFGGQHFIPEAYNKIAAVSALLEQRNSAAIIQVDGGVTPENTCALIEAGADSLVSGSAFFNAPPYASRLLAFTAEADKSRREAKRVDWKQL